MLNEISSEDLKLSINFEIEKHQERILEIKINGFSSVIKDNVNFFDWFMEDLVFFLDKNKLQRRWDYGKILLKNIKSLNLSKEQEESFKNNLKTITSWDMEAV